MEDIQETNSNTIVIVAVALAAAAAIGYGARKALAKFRSQDIEE